MFINMSLKNECACCRLKDVTSLCCGWTVIKKVKISALKFSMLFDL